MRLNERTARSPVRHQKPIWQIVIIPKLTDAPFNCDQPISRRQSQPNVIGIKFITQPNDPVFRLEESPQLVMFVIFQRPVADGLPAMGRTVEVHRPARRTTRKYYQENRKYGEGFWRCHNGRRSS